MVVYIRTGIRREDLVSTALGEDKADVVITNGSIVNVASGEIYKTDVAIRGERIALVGNADHTIGDLTKKIDARGIFLIPGLIDCHIHIEASLVTPTEFARVVLPRGNTTVVVNPSWTANVLGLRGVKLIVEEAERIPLKIFLDASSCVPLAPNYLLTPGYEFGVAEIREMLSWDSVVGLGEVNDFHRVLIGDKVIHSEIQATFKAGKIVNGNAPKMIGNELNAYLAAGIQSDHEAISVEEAVERLRCGVRLIIRQGSSEHNLEDLIQVVTKRKLDSRHCCFCTDDKHLRDLTEEGLIDHAVRLAIKAGVNPITAIQMATLNAAEHIGLDRELGSISPGKIADILFIEDLEKLQIKRVMVDGQVIANNGKLLISMPNSSYPKWALKTFHVKRKLKPADLSIKTKRCGNVRVWVIKVVEGQVISERIIETLNVEKGEVIPDLDKDVIKVAVVERYGKTEPNIGKGFTKGFTLRSGAFGSSISTDTHHIVAVGTNDVDITKVVNRVAEIQGGIVISKNGTVIDELKLPFAGVMSLKPYEEIVKDLGKLHENAKNLGCRLKSPFMTLSFMANPSLPELKLSDKGLMYMSERIIPLEVEE